MMNFHIDIEIKRKYTKALISSTPVLQALWVAVVELLITI